MAGRVSNRTPSISIEDIELNFLFMLATLWKNLVLQSPAWSHKALDFCLHEIVSKRETLAQSAVATNLYTSSSLLRLEDSSFISREFISSMSLCFLASMSPKTSLFHTLSFSLRYFSLLATRKLAKPGTCNCPHHLLIRSLKPSYSSNMFLNLNGAFPVTGTKDSRKIGKWLDKGLDNLFWTIFGKNSS